MTILQSALDIKYVVENSLVKINDTFAKDAIKKKHKIRVRFYQLVKDYINSPGSESPNAFFDWYLEQLDRRIENKPEMIKVYYSLTGQKNEQSFRAFLVKCRDDLAINPKFIDVLRDWLPRDELQIIDSTSSSDISDVLDIAIEMANDKQIASEQIKGAIFSNLPLILIGGFFHWFIYEFVYRSFVIPGFADTKNWEDMIMVEKNYVIYEWFMQSTSWITLALVFIGTYAFFSWSIRSWHIRLVHIRENYFDYLPPYSLSKINNQYGIIMIINNFMKSGKSFGDALEQAIDGASPYIRMQVEKIIGNSGAKANDAINTFYLGDYGSDIQERGNHIPLEQAMDSLLPAMKKIRKDKFDKTINITLMLTLKPAIYASFGLALIPLFIQIFANLPAVD
jgi:hypothetical protein